MMLGFWLTDFSWVGCGFSWKAWTAALGKASLSPEIQVSINCQDTIVLPLTSFSA